MLCWKDSAMIYCFHHDTPWVLFTSSCLFLLNEHISPSFLSNSPLYLIPILMSGNSVVLAWSSLPQLTPFPKVVNGILHLHFPFCVRRLQPLTSKIISFHVQTFLHVIPRKGSMTSCADILKNITLISTEQYWWYSSVLLLMPYENSFYCRTQASKTRHQEENTEFNKIFVVSFSPERTQLSKQRNTL